MSASSSAAAATRSPSASSAGIDARRAAERRPRRRRAPPTPRLRPRRRRRSPPSAVDAASRRPSAWRRRSRSAPSSARSSASGAAVVDLVELEAHQVEVALARALAVGQLGELALGVADRAVRRAIGLAQLEMVRAREAVEDVELRRAERQAPVLVLAEEGEEPGAEELQVGDACGAALHVGARAPRRADAAGDHELLGVLGQALGELGQLRVVPEARGQLEDALDVGLRARPGAPPACAPCRPSGGRASARARSCPRRSRP